MDQGTQVSSNKINLKAKANLFCLTVLTLGILKMEKWKVKECLDLKMVQSMMGSIRTIGSMVQANIRKME